MKHAKDYSASSSARWINCPGSVIAVREYQNKGSSYANIGTAVHELCAIGLEKFLNDDQIMAYVGKTLSDAPDVVIDKQMAINAIGYVDYCRSIKGDHFVEVNVSYENVVTDGFGTSDFISINAEDKFIDCVDYKNGQLEVSAIENTQAQMYALGVLNEYDFVYNFDETWVIRVHIYQPNINNFSEWSIPYSQLMDFANHVRQQVALSKQPNAPFNPSDSACKWCLHKANCKALQEHTEQVISAQFDDLTLPDASSVDVVNVLKNKSLIESWLKAVEQSVFEKLMSGDTVTGFKLVAGRTTRKWADESVAYGALSEFYGDDELQTRKLITAPQAEKLVGKARFNELYNNLVEKSDGRPTLAPESDKRKPFGDVTCDFENIS